MIPSVKKVVAIYRDAFGGLPLVTWLLCLAAFVNRCGSMVLPLLNLYLVYDTAGAAVLWLACGTAGIVSALGFLASHKRR